MGHFRTFTYACFTCARQQADRSAVFFGPGLFVKCEACGGWKPEEWLSAEAKIQAVVLNATVRQKQWFKAQAATTTTKTGAPGDLGDADESAEAAAPMLFSYGTRPPRHRAFYPIPLSFSRDATC